MAVVLTSLCVNLPINLPFLNVPSPTGTSGLEFSNEDIYMNVNTLPSEVSGGGNVTLIFQIINKANYDLEDVGLLLYDPCVFSGESGELRNHVATLKPNRTMSWSWNLKSDVITLTRDCEMKFRLYYSGKFSLFQDMVVLTQAEYNSRLLQGTLNSIPISSSSSNSPLKISLTFTEAQPLLTGTENDMQINYVYTGSGFMEVEKLEIKVPDNLEPVNPSTNCKDYSYTGNTLTLNKPFDRLRFINKRASPSVCTFKTKASQPLDIKSLTLTADYTYIFDDSITVRVKGTSK